MVEVRSVSNLTMGTGILLMTASLLIGTLLAVPLDVKVGSDWTRLGSLLITVLHQDANSTNFGIQCEVPEGVTVNRCSIMEQTKIQSSGPAASSRPPTESLQLVVSTNGTRNCNADLIVGPTFGATEYFCQFDYYLPKICGNHPGVQKPQQLPLGSEGGQKCRGSSLRHGRSEKSLLMGTNNSSGLRPILLTSPESQQSIFYPGEELHLSCWSNFLVPHGHCVWEFNPFQEGFRAQIIPAQAAVSSRLPKSETSGISPFLQNITVTQDGYLCFLRIGALGVSHTGNWTCASRSASGDLLYSPKGVPVRLKELGLYTLALHAMSQERELCYCELPMGSLPHRRPMGSCRYEVEKGANITLECSGTKIKASVADVDSKIQQEGAFSWLFQKSSTGSEYPGISKRNFVLLGKSSGTNMSATLNITGASHAKDTGVYCCSSGSATGPAACLMLEVDAGNLRQDGRQNKGTSDSGGHDAEASLILGGMVVVIGLVLIVFFICNVRNKTGNICQSVGDEAGSIGSADSMAMFRETVEKCNKQAGDHIDTEEGQPEKDHISRDDVDDDAKNEASHIGTQTSGGSKRVVKKVAFRGAPRRSLSTVAETPEKEVDTKQTEVKKRTEQFVDVPVVDDESF